MSDRSRPAIFYERTANGVRRGHQAPRLAQRHRDEELRVGLDLLEPGLEQLHRFDDVHIAQDLSEAIHELELLLLQEQLFATGAAGGDMGAMDVAPVEEVVAEEAPAEALAEEAPAEEVAAEAPAEAPAAEATPEEKAEG